MYLRIVSGVLVAFLLVAFFYDDNSSEYDLIVYGGTPAGVSAAVAGSEEGLSTILISRDKSVGGIASNGISASDVGSTSVLSGLPLKFYDKAKDYYGLEYIKWRYEPHVAESIFKEMLNHAKVTVLYDAALVGVEKDENKMHCINTNERKICGKYFIDSSYEGDLLALSGTDYHLGMEDYFSYSEPLTSERTIHKVADIGNNEKVFLSNPFISNKRKKIIEGMPSITYRTCITDLDSNKIPFTSTDKYPSYAPAWRLVVNGVYNKQNCEKCSEVYVSRLGTITSPFFQLAKIPHHKFDFNSGSSSFMNVTVSKDYFDTLAVRDSFQAELKEYMQNWFYFLQNDNEIPEKYRKIFSNYGLCSDEFVSNKGWPNQPYLREGRRIVGDYTITQKDLLTNRTKQNSIAVGSYHIDGKPSQWFVENKALYRDKFVYITTPIYEIPYTSLFSKKGPENLLVTIGISASPLSYGSIRMEPTYMAIGEAAGVAASVANNTQQPFYAIDASKIQTVLKKRDATYDTTEVCKKKIPIKYRQKAGFTPDCRLIKFNPINPSVLRHNKKIED